MPAPDAIIAYLRNMRAALENEQPEHAAYLFQHAMEWLHRHDSEASSPWPAVRYSLGIGLHAGRNPKQPNEDYTFAEQLVRSLGSGAQETMGLFVVADGMGGHTNGQKASRLAVHALVDYLLPQLSSGEDLRGPALKELLVKGVRRANGEVHRRKEDMGTTLTAVVSVGVQAYVASVGDSRAYLYRPGYGLAQLTRDHSLVAAKALSGEITPEQVYTHPKRNVILRALGEEEVVIDEPARVLLQDGDVLLLCSDGLWEMVRDPEGEEIAAILAKAQLSAQAMAKQLVQLALQGGGHIARELGGGHDNVGIVVVRSQIQIADCETIPLEPLR